MQERDQSIAGFVPTEYFYEGQKDKTLAFISFVVSVFSFLTLGFAGLGTLAGLVLSIIALVKIRQNPARFGGRGLAIGAIVLSSLSGVLFGVIVFAIIHNLSGEPQMLAAEEAAISRMRGIARSEDTYRRYVSHGTYGTIEELHAKGLIDHRETKEGYTFVITLENKSFEAFAVPNEYGSTGRRSFYVTTDGLIRAADKQGRIGDRGDPPLR
jgi:hypothetical protein